MGNSDPGTMYRYSESRLIMTMVVYESISRVIESRESQSRGGSGGAW